MQSQSISTRRSQKEWPGVNIVPERCLQTEICPLHPGQTFENLTEAGCCSRLVSSESLEDTNDDFAVTKAEGMVMAEIAEFLEANERDEYWSLQQPRRVFPTPNAVVAQLTTSAHRTTVAESQLFDNIIRMIAVQLLATCYTLLPATSAYDVPLFHQRKEARIVTALRLHTYHRFSPATGYHARESSEISSWPGLYPGPSLEDVLAETICERRRVEKFSGEPTISMQIPEYRSERTMDASQWSDGPAEQDDRRTMRSNRNSSSHSEPGFVSRLTCQTSIRKDSHKSDFLFHHFTGKGKQQPEPRDKMKMLPACPRSSSMQRLTSQALLKIPSSLRLRHTQSLPRSLSKDKAIELTTLGARRNSSSPEIDSPIPYPFDIPEIRRISASSAIGTSLASAHICGSGGCLATQSHSPGSRSIRFDMEALVLPPLDPPETVVAGGGARRGDYFGPTPPATVEGRENDSNGSKTPRMSDSDYGDTLSFSDGNGSSEDSVDNERKRKPVVGSLVNSVEEFSQRVHEREGEPP